MKKINFLTFIFFQLIIVICMILAFAINFHIGFLFAAITIILQFNMMHKFYKEMNEKGPTRWGKKIEKFQLNMKYIPLKLLQLCFISLLIICLTSCSSDTEQSFIYSDLGTRIDSEASLNSLGTFEPELLVTEYEDTYSSKVINATSISSEKTEERNVLTEELTVFVQNSSSFDFSTVPAYNQSPYVIINNNEPYFSDNDLTITSYEYYSDLDFLGRCGECIANVGIDIMPTEKRGNIGSIKPTGWHTVKYDKVDGKYLYNRCHLIGYQLSGENANEKNLITGTRYLNVQGMLPFENMVTDYVKETDNHVLYRVTPIFEGDNLLASGVLMEARSIEDQGEGILFCVYCYNVQPGITIDYATGESEESLDFQIAADSEFITNDLEIVGQGNSNSAENNNISVLTSYVLNTNSKKFHNPNCSSISQISEKNKMESIQTRDELISQGYSPCSRCNP